MFSGLMTLLENNKYTGAHEKLHLWPMKLQKSIIEQVFLQSLVICIETFD